MIRTTIGALTLLAVLTGAAAAQDYPNRAIKFLHGFPPGGNVDIIARLLGNEMSKGLGQSSPTATRCWSFPARTRRTARSPRM